MYIDLSLSLSLSTYIYIYIYMCEVPLRALEALVAAQADAGALLGGR